MIPVSDVRSNSRDQIGHAVEVLGRSKARLAVFSAIYRGKKKIKAVNEIAASTGLSRVRVLQEGLRLASNELVEQLRLGGLTAYKKYAFYSANKGKILTLAKNKKAFSRFHTKVRPAPSTAQVVKVRLAVPRPRTRQVTVDDIDSFSGIREVEVLVGTYTPIPEARFKRGVARILGDSGEFQDWGGETNDLYTTKLRMFGSRVTATFAFKGPGKKGVLSPAKMGKNGNQIQRLFRLPADLYVVQYWGQIGEDVIEQLRTFAVAKAAVGGERVFYGVIDGDDSTRLMIAYPKAFKRRG